MFKYTCGTDMPPTQIAREKNGIKLTYIQTNQVQTMIKSLVDKVRDNMFKNILKRILPPKHSG
jgi:hypothetical protein